jgi:probable HAF family extracellular repeat protein
MRLPAALAPAATILAVGSAVSAQDFTSTEWTGGSSQAAGANSAGEVGVTAENEDFDARAVVFGDDYIIEFDTLGGDFSEMGDLAETGMAVGGAENAEGRMRPFRGWTPDELEDLGDLGGQTGFATAVDFSGDVVAGWSLDPGGQERAFRWTPAAGMINLGTFGGLRSMALGVSGDGLAVVGWARTETESVRAFRWTEAQGLVNLGTLEGGGSSQAEGADGSGAVIVGSAIDANGDRRAVRWTAQGGLTELPGLPGGLDATALDVSADGLWIVGQADTPDGPRAVLWDSNGQIVDLNTEYAAVIPEGWLLERAEAISADGTYIAGTGFGPGGQQGWLIDTLGRCGFCCYPDFNRDGTLDLFDFLAFVNEFNAGGAAADCDGGGGLDLFDFLCFANTFNAGC